jgi:hypothetical protein
MRFTELSEAGTPANFHDHADQALGHLVGLAKKARGNIKDQKEKAAAQAKKAEADSTRAKKHKNAVSAGLGAPALIAQMVLDTTPEEDSLVPIQDFDAEHLNSFMNEISKTQNRIAKFPVALQKVLKDSDFLDAVDKKDIRSLTSDQPEHTLDAPEQLLMRNKHGEQEAWKLAMTSDDQAEVGKAMLANIAKISRENQRQNQANTGAGRNRTLAVGTALIRSVAAQRQVLDARLSVLKGLVEKHATATPITTEQLKRVKRLLEKMR